MRNSTLHPIQNHAMRFPDHRYKVNCIEQLFIFILRETLSFTIIFSLLQIENRLGSSLKRSHSHSLFRCVTAINYTEIEFCSNSLSYFVFQKDPAIRITINEILHIITQDSYLWRSSWVSRTVTFSGYFLLSYNFFFFTNISSDLLKTFRLIVVPLPKTWRKCPCQPGVSSIIATGQQAT